MAEHDLDVFDDDRSRRRIFQEFDQAIRESNRAAVSAATGAITKDSVLRVAITVSRLRARYLREVLKLSSEGGDRALDPTAILDLRQMREAYEEALSGFGALRHALERGYFDLAPPKK
ncbi:MAG: hypothetical protein EXQ93_05675 [Alphaproteobacteria bacterium]|nr:hypothetical protein [Alphaproteobacteria bacterium]